MRRFYFPVAILLTALIALLFASRSHAQNSDEIQKYIQEWLNTYQPVIEQGETDYFKSNGVYWQGIATHTDTAKPEYTATDKTEPIAKDSKVFVGDCLACKPTDQVAAPSWSELFPDIVGKLPASLAIDTYVGPEGAGYILRLDYCVDGICYQQLINVGPERWRDQQWTELKPESTDVSVSK